MSVLNSAKAAFKNKKDSPDYFTSSENSIHQTATQSSSDRNYVVPWTSERKWFTLTCKNPHCKYHLCYLPVNSTRCYVYLHNIASPHKYIYFTHAARNTVHQAKQWRKRWKKLSDSTAVACWSTPRRRNNTPVWIWKYIIKQLLAMNYFNIIILL